MTERRPLHRLLSEKKGEEAHFRHPALYGDLTQNAEPLPESNEHAMI